MKKRYDAALQRAASCLLASGLAIGVAAPAAAAYPEKPIVVVVPFAPGGSTDQIGRLVAEHFHKDFGVPVIVENRPGAAGTVGSAHVARSAPDGYTLLIGGSDTVASQFLYENLPYDPERDLTPIGIVSEFPFLMLVDKRRKLGSVKEYVDYARQNPQKVSFSSAGMGNSTHLAGEVFKKAAGLDSMVHVPYNGSALALTAVVSGQVDFAFDPAMSSIQLVHGGKADALAVVAGQRLPALPDVPLMSELGYTEFDQLSPWSWKGLFAPAGTPEETLEKLTTSLAALLSDQGFQKRIEDTASLVVPPQSRTQAQEFLTRQRAGWGDLIRATGVEPQ
ncbi:tripartite tricarboxylate transporter substrate binding protein [Verticiella sediminum]|uniref:Tripartite tricarboxylate transporter substrate binding protein n=1 Tax=Verticiella sediminum TaxID=1247510 RepID=A0A556AVF5_9BURK|nr:tripartite tricarboxylate transporter substrate binding protein [Verticiella sediminum]TSH96921.1 tripartite tricarboxylate transporter substrate binding protein [Verticiella sediminum]